VPAEHPASGGYDLKVFFTVVGKSPRRVRPVDVLGFVTAQRTGGDGRLQIAGPAASGGIGPDAAAAAVERVGAIWVLAGPRGCERESGAAGLPTRREWQRPGQGVPLVRVPRTLPQILGPAEVDALTAALRTHRDRAMAAAMVLGGLHRCEVLGLRLAELRFGERRLFITEGKGGHQRLIPVSARFFTEVSAYLDAERPAGAGTDLALGCALDLHEAAAAGADDVHVGLGFDVFLVVEFGQEHATDDADADHGDRAGERLGLGPDGVPHDRSVGC
jgi:integrase/recombinase XerD